jgi:hypothetical protein
MRTSRFNDVAASVSPSALERVEAWFGLPVFLNEYCGVAGTRRRSWRERLFGRPWRPWRRLADTFEPRIVTIRGTCVVMHPDLWPQVVARAQRNGPASGDGAKHPHTPGAGPPGGPVARLEQREGHNGRSAL